jgi:hypothetical protein
MPLEEAFAPYRLVPGALPEEAARAADALAATPLLAAPAEPLPAPLVNRALADLPAGRAAAASEACRAADGTPSGLPGPLRACLSSERQRARLAEAARAALEAGFAGVCLDRPDAALALGPLGAGFCPDCQRELGRLLEREYGEHFQPLDYLALAREALAQSSGAVGVDQLPFGRDFWRMRTDALERALRADARAVRDAARVSGRSFEVVAQFEKLGPVQLRAARLLDGTIYPATVPAAPGAGLGLARLLRAAAGRRPVAVAPTGPALPPQALARFAAVAATCAVDLSGLEPSGEAGAEVAAVRRLSRQLGQRAGRSAAAAEPVAECCILYSTEADLWTQGRHRRAVERAGDALAALHVQAPVVLRVSDAPPGAVVVLADAGALAPVEATALRRRLEAGGGVLAFGEPAQVDESGRPAGSFLPSGKPGGAKVGKGVLAALPALEPEEGTPASPEPAQLERALSALLGKGRRAARVSGRARVLVVLHRTGERLDVHLVSAGEERAQGAMLFLGDHVAGGVRRGRFVSADGADVRIPLNPSGYSISTVLPSFKGYAVLSLSA